ncbi:23S rRNA (uracil(1939)-C(5))-methyltransferase RlmD [Holzapfeliella sp. JNUCC 80]
MKTIKNNNTLVGKEAMITIKRMGINGEGIGFYKKKIIFVPQAITDEIVIVQITEEKRNYLRGELIRVKEKSPNRVDFPKGVNPAVGGLELAHLNYASQLDFKRDVFRQALEKYSPQGYTNYDLRPTIGSKQEWHYRTKAQYQLGFEKGKVLAGLYQANSHNLIDLPAMPTQSELSQDTVRKIVKLIEELSIFIYNPRNKKTGIKTLAVRNSYATKEVQVTFITSQAHIKGLDKLADKVAQLPNVVSVMQNINDQDTSLVWGKETTLLKGKRTITEKIKDKEFILSPQAFFQLNPPQTEVLYDHALKALDLSEDDVLVDAYSGVGTLGISAADKVKRVYGMEIIKDAVKDANYNVELNHLDNVSYQTGKAEAILPHMVKRGTFFNSLIVDPPRSGLSQDVLQAILKVKPQKFVYISCNASTLAKDLITLTREYKVEFIQSIDMFPQTPKVEAVVKLIKK